MLCDFHREKSWTEWVKKKNHNVFQHQKEILSMLRNIAYADNMDSFNRAMKTLQTSEIWKKKTVLSLVFNKVVVISKGNPYIICLSINLSDGPGTNKKYLSCYIGRQFKIAKRQKCLGIQVNRIAAINLFFTTFLTLGQAQSCPSFFCQVITL